MNGYEQILIHHWICIKQNNYWCCVKGNDLFKDDKDLYYLIDTVAGIDLDNVRIAIYRHKYIYIHVHVRMLYVNEIFKRMLK
ncbi:hypothetical protein RFI_31794 [Reticulomyxa filosa]|uniref:Uncharacterized protein n=1 Tax=Reticulomyxa filosa TaxID=46433 RepID=X6LWS8_RETFI|nr:hypothetical protein RFI_31794 [Reticulomyxa filosa]|eukprot:ETO05602.1 hypothetical protein RFI_31794 [Reticulomyxa filosa]